MKLYRLDTPYILEYNPHPFYSFRGLKNRREDEEEDMNCYWMTLSKTKDIGI